MGRQHGALYEGDDPQVAAIPERWSPGHMPIRYIPRPETIPLNFTKGIDESQETSALQLGQLSACANWVPEPSNVLRARNRWVFGPSTVLANTDGDGDTSSYPANRKIRSITRVPFDDTATRGDNQWFVVGLQGNTGKPELWIVKTVLTTGYRLMSQGAPGVNTDLDNWPHVVAKGIKSALFTHPAMTGIRWWGGNIAPTTSLISNSPPARALVFHKSRFFAGGTDPANASWVQGRLYFSNINHRDGWAGSGDPPSQNNNYIDVDAGAGDAIEDLVAFQGNLLIGKSTGVYILSGSDPDTFQLTKIDGVRCDRGRTLVATPSGVCIFGPNEAWLWNGGTVQVISLPVRSSYQAGGASGYRQATYAGGLVYLTSTAPGAPLLAFDPAHGSWYTESVGNDNELPVALANDGSRLLGGPRNSSTAPPVSYRDIGFGSRDHDDTPVQVTYTARTPDYFFGHSERPVTGRHVWLRLRQRGGDVNSNALKVLAFVDKNPQAEQDIPARAAGVFTTRIDFGATGDSFGLQFSTTVPASGGTTWDIEEVLVQADLAPAR